MSLTRAQWLEMWTSIKRVEGLALNARTMSEATRSALLREAGTLKEFVQSVVGQLE